MRYYTRDLYNRIQADHSGTLGDWSAADLDYMKEMQASLPELKNLVGNLFGVTLHDGVIESVIWPTSSSLRLRVDCESNPWGPNGMVEVIFTGVTEASDLNKIIGDVWLYEESHLHDEGFQYEVLLGESEFYIIAAGASLQLI